MFGAIKLLLLLFFEERIDFKLFSLFLYVIKEQFSHMEVTPLSIVKSNKHAVGELDLDGSKKKELYTFG